MRRCTWARERPVASATKRSTRLPAAPSGTVSSRRSLMRRVPCPCAGRSPPGRPAGRPRTARGCPRRPRHRRCSRRTSACRPTPMSTKSMTWPRRTRSMRLPMAPPSSSPRPDRHEQPGGRPVPPLEPGDASDDEQREGGHDRRDGLEDAEDGAVVVGLGDAHELAEQFGRAARLARRDGTRGDLEGGVHPQLGGLVEEDHDAGQAQEERPAAATLRCRLAGRGR